MKERVWAIIRLAVAMFAYPLAFGLLIYIWWSGAWIGWGVLVIVVLLAVDRTWLFVARQILRFIRR